MSQDYISTFDPQDSGAELVAWLIANFAAILSSHTGEAAPAYAERGTWWADTTTAGVLTYKIYDGTDWNTVFSLNEGTGAITFPTISVGTASAVGHALNLGQAQATFATIASLGGYAAKAGATFTGTLQANAAFVAAGDFTAQGANITLAPTSNQLSVTGRVLITTTGTTDNLRLNRTGGTTPYSWVIFQNAGVTGGSIQWTGSATAYNTSSDGRLKPVREDFNPGPIIDGTVVVRHNWLHAPDMWSYSVIAQDAQKVFPQAVSEGSGEPGDEDFQPWGVDYSKYVPVLLEEMKRLRARVAALESAHG
jgi:hypothetical protein